MCMRLQLKSIELKKVTFFFLIFLVERFIGVYLFKDAKKVKKLLKKISKEIISKNKLKRKFYSIILS